MHPLPLNRRAVRFASMLLPCLLAACGSSTTPTALNGSTPPEVTAKACTNPADATTERVRNLLDGEQLGVVVSFDGSGPLGTDRVNALRALGLKGYFLNHLPIAGVLATKAQIEQIEKLPGVRSVRWNAPLSYDNEDARYLSSVDQAQAAPELHNALGEPITGKGVTILVNDSGIDATHLDLSYGSKVQRNALGHLNLNAQDDMLPFTPVEGVPNSDVLGSHGTHVAGIAAGDGSASDGRFAGAAKGATLAGYGSGAVIFVLDTLGGFDYALQLLEEAPELNLRIVTNSFGNTDDIGTCFDPEDPTNIATKALADRGVIVVFSAGNSGSGQGTITGNFKKAPWVLAAGNGEKTGLLAPSSSRGSLANAVYQVEVDGETYTVEDRPTVVTPGTDIISTRAVAADPFTPLDTEADIAAGDIPPELIPFYTHKTGTSMAAPHLAGLTALLLEANPELTWREVKQIFKTTATNMPGYDTWQVGAGYANIEAALAMALSLRKDYGATNHAQRSFFAEIPLGESIQNSYAIDFLPAGPTGEETFEVGEDISLVMAQWNQPLGNLCTCAVVLIDPNGTHYGSSIALPLLGSNVAAVGTGVPGTWTVTVRGIGSVSGVPVDPAGVTNGVAGPGTADVNVLQFRAAQPRGLDDIAGHPQAEFIEAAVAERLVDGTRAGFQADAPLTRGDFAEYLMAWGVRQTRPHDGSEPFADLAGASNLIRAAATAVSRSGQLIMSRSPASLPLLPLTGTSFAPTASVTREQVAYALVQAIGRQANAESYAGTPLTAPDAEGNPVAVADAGDVDPALLGHVQDALNLGILKADFAGGVATIAPKHTVTRGDYAEYVVRTFAIVPFPS
ncbi:S8 family serine peptidase [Sinimarinibacterium sp. CAU 1509]|uniref:S8 family serine peptidase n=1 Tax=Sinimarinibacterium sp. CAU 1509 TaxID=2562283 RepID=UPI00146F6652|nr:S8 family serine peptidase [Sinimarinibacterium sp. CAU 1509]